MNDLAPGEYSVDAFAPPLKLAEPRKVTVDTSVQRLNLQLRVAVTVHGIALTDASATSVSTDPAGNASAVVLAGKDLAALADDPEDLAADLQALAEPSAVPTADRFL